MLSILFIGDICGKVGRQTVKNILPQLRTSRSIDFVIANVENAAGGRGVTRKILLELGGYGIDFFTSGDHVWRNREFLEDLNDDSLPIIRPANFPDDIVYGKGYKIVDLGGKGLIAIINLQGWTYMKELVLDPLRYIDSILEELNEKDLQAILVDFHAEATSEKAIFGHYADGRISAALGTHTHIGTVDTKILPKGTGFVTDIGMVGPTDSSLWVRKEIAIHNYKYPYKKAFRIQKFGPRVFNSVLMKIVNMRCDLIERIDRIDNNNQ